LLGALPALYGGLDVLQRARRVVAAGSTAARALDELEQLIERLTAVGLRSTITLDLGEVRGFDYYTGTRFAVYAAGAGGALASGGRYDELVARYGRAARATGFAVDVDRVTGLLRDRGRPAPEPAGGLLVGGDAVLAGRLAGLLRRRGERTVLDLDEPPAAEAELTARARRQGLARVTVVETGRLRWFAAQEGGARGDLSGEALDRLLRAGDEAALDALLPPR
jgi:ATP phosphoribosyltransferase regulatory subunit